MSDVAGMLGLLSAAALIIGILVHAHRGTIRAKDATIESQNQRIATLEGRVEDLKDRSPDVLLERRERRIAVQAAELEACEQEKKLLAQEVEALKSKLESQPSDADTATIKQLYQIASVRLAAVTAERDRLRRSAQVIEGPYENLLYQFRAYDAGISPGRRQIATEIVKYFGAERVVDASDDELVLKFAALTSAIDGTAGFDRGLPTNGGGLTGLRSGGLTDDQGMLTPIGVAVLKGIAKAILKSGERASAPGAE